MTNSPSAAFTAPERQALSPSCLVLIGSRARTWMSTRYRFVPFLLLPRNITKAMSSCHTQQRALSPTPRILSQSPLKQQIHTHSSFWQGCRILEAPRSRPACSLSGPTLMTKNFITVRTKTFRGLAAHPEGALVQNLWPTLSSISLLNTSRLCLLHLCLLHLCLLRLCLLRRQEP